MGKTDILKDLEKRGLLYQITDRGALEKRLKAGPITLYIGFDPTADSLHIGNLLPMLCLRRFQMAGHNPIAVAGGGTGLIGDPSGRNLERALNPEAIVHKWTEKIKNQLEKFLDFKSKTNPARIVNNYDWLSSIKVIEFLRDTGKYFSIGNMLSKESVKSRLDTGISYTEFSYIILQAYDFLRLYQDYNCEMQAGGSDQWGNITAGTDLIKRVAGGAAYGLTFPLVTKSDDTKFGKTETGAIWLDPKKTTPYQFYQFWINADDRDVVKFINYFTFLSEDEISDLEEKTKKEPEKREAQRVLAKEVTLLVHGEKEALSAEKISQALFYGNLKDLSEEEIEEGFKDIPSMIIKNKKEIGIAELILAAGVLSSKRQAKAGISSGAISINGNIFSDTDKIISASDRLWNKYIIIRKGKKNYFLVKWM
ncbi:MAG: tyrosine--tRNA ligase [Candidatus Tagabacteria bacterium CG_4_9_14_0_2_um_filter_41_11]|uniref:Tyrosine--tRNA ligase n=1 Tax=Candidatus Tagabacteria bacterium CG_4_9_14_0_2_um_filter_41_11 TaxID=1975019 RepID=A0A2M8EQL1_9BACT|nr:MAG: tyrosine--tRNA ligase [Candidatus Tagabacteria bacterium CG_4_9_14_0_2_um_filter_41_11]